MIGKFWDGRAARILFTALIFVLALWFLREARQTLTLFLFAILFAYFIEPLVTRLERPMRGRMRSLGVVYLALIIILVGAGWLIGPRIVHEARSLAQTLPSLLDRMSSGQLVSQIGQKHGWSQERQLQLQSLFMDHRTEFLTFVRAVGAKLAEPASHIWWLILIPILSLFFLKDGETIAANMIDFGRDEQEKNAIRGIVGDINVMLGSYIRSQLILSSLTLIAYTLVLTLLRVPYAFILGPLAGLFEFIPVVGPAIAAISVLVIAVLSGFPHVAALVVFLGAWRLIQDYVSAPRIMGKSLEISPLVQIFGVLAGGEIGGVVGALISVPVIATLRILWRRMSGSLPPNTPATATIPTNDLPEAVMHEHSTESWRGAVQTMSDRRS